jgi:hypothetical protein
MHHFIKIHLSIITFFVFVFSSFAQDKIITLKHDTIDCKIIELNNNKIAFHITTKGIISTGVLPRTEVLTYLVSPESFHSLINQQKASDHKTEKKLNRVVNDSIYKNHPRFSFQIHSGYGYLTASSAAAASNLVRYGFDSSLANDYYKRFRNTILSGVSFQFTPFEFKYYALSVGLTYMNQMSSSSISGTVDPGDGVHFYNGTYSEHIYANHYGLSLRHTFFFNKTKKTNVFLEGGSGLVTYRNELHFLYSPMLLKSVAPGSSIKLGLETDLTKFLSININAGYYLAILKNITVNNGLVVQETTLPKGNYESLGKITLLAGLSYKF